LKTEKTYTSAPLSWDFTHTWAIRDGESFPYFQYQSAPVVITSFSTLDATFNTLAPGSIDVYKGADMIYIGTFENSTTSDIEVHAVLKANTDLEEASTINDNILLWDVAKGDTLYFIYREPNKAPSYPVSVIVDRVGTPTVKFVLTDAGENSIAGAVVTFNNTTNAAGDYSFKNITEGTYSYSISKRGYVMATGSITVSNTNVIENVVLNPISMNRVNVAVTGNTTYTGNAIMPYFTVSYKGTPLVKNTDYRVNGYGENINVADNAYIFIEGMDQFTDRKVISFDITPAVPQKVVFPIITGSYVYSPNRTLADLNIRFTEFGAAGDGIFTWKQETTPLTTGETEYELNFVPDDAGNYDYSDIAGWNAVTQTVTRKVLLKVTENPLGAPGIAGEETQIYPNPFSDVLNIDNGGTIIKYVWISDLNGRRKAQAEPRNTTCLFATSAWAPGIYIVTIESENSISHHKVVKR
jgi:hypothetical protein